MAFIMGIITMIRMTKNMPRKLNEAALYSSPAYYAGTMMKAASLPCNDYMSFMKRMAELEEKVTVLNKRSVMPPEKEEVLNNALNRVTTLEQDLVATKKVYNFSFLFNSMSVVSVKFSTWYFYFGFRHLMMPLLDKENSKLKLTRKGRRRSWYVISDIYFHKFSVGLSIDYFY